MRAAPDENPSTCAPSEDRLRSQTRAGNPDDAAESEDATSSALELQRLREENAILRQSADTFGALAERLHIALQRERRNTTRPGGTSASGSQSSEA